MTMPAVVDAMAGRVPVIFDGGITRGINVSRALTLNATAAGAARPVLFGAALGGAGGMQSVLQHLTDEPRAAMPLAGVRMMSGINRNNLLLPLAHEKDA